MTFNAINQQISMQIHEATTIVSQRYLDSDLIAPVVIIGAGPVGRYLAAKLLEQPGNYSVLLIGDEAWEPYDRVKLSSYLAGDVTNVAFGDGLKNNPRFRQYVGIKICSIQRQDKVVIDQNGQQCPYDKLILALGSSPHKPPIHGINLQHVYNFRNMSDAQRLKARMVRSRHTIVIGGGLLGLEAARAMCQFNTNVTIIEQSAWLMFHQLDEDIANLLQIEIENNGINVITNSRVQKIQGNDSVNSIILTNGKNIICDTVIVATGIIANTDLASRADLKVNRGVLVNDHLQTSDPDVYAIGECAEHRQTVYGLVNPGYEQATVVAHQLANQKSSYQGSLSATQLKVIGCPVYSIGEPSTEWYRKEIVYKDSKNNVLRKIFIAGNRLDAAIAIGEWSDFARIQEAVKQRRRIWPWQILRFKKIGSLWQQDAEAGVTIWPANAIVCHCMSVNRSALTCAVNDGCNNLEQLSQKTGAGTVCGSCQPLLQQFFGTLKIKPIGAANILASIGSISLLLILTFLLVPVLPYNNSVQDVFRWDVLWRDPLYKQISGFSLLGMSILLAFISVPKRLQKISWGNFSAWRALHVVIGMIIAITLVAHTGLRLGHNLNQYLMVIFVLLLLAGAVTSSVMGLQHVMPIHISRHVRNISIWMHILMLWPLPVLLGFHVLKTYWF